MSMFKPVTTVTRRDVFIAQQYFKFLMSQISLAKPVQSQNETLDITIKTVMIGDFKFDVSESSYDTEVITTIDATFNRNGRTWRVTVVTDTFIIATATDAERDKRGDLVNSFDIIKVNR